MLNCLANFNSHTWETPVKTHSLTLFIARFTIIFYMDHKSTASFTGFSAIVTTTNLQNDETTQLSQKPEAQRFKNQRRKYYSTTKHYSKEFSTIQLLSYQITWREEIEIYIKGSLNRIYCSYIIWFITKRSLIINCMYTSNYLYHCRAGGQDLSWHLSPE